MGCSGAVVRSWGCWRVEVGLWSSLLLTLDEIRTGLVLNAHLAILTTNIAYYIPINHADTQKGTADQ